MPASCAKAFRPTTALLAWTGSPVSSVRSWLAAKRTGVRMPVANGSRSDRTRRAMTSSSSDAFPALSPMPLIVHSICRAPPSMAASELATAIPRSSWQWAERTASFPSGSFAATARNIARISSGTE